MEQHKPYWNRMVPELTVTDFSLSLDFYQNILGFQLLIRRSNPDFAYLTLGEAQLMLEALHDDGWNTAPLNYPLGRGVNFQIEVDDLAPLLHSLKVNNIKLYQEVKDNHYRIDEVIACQREFLVQDPDGYLLRFSQFIENIMSY
ncbi:VOC family protein [Photorhabdus noenieputensis]|uniref:bleomycin resistance protein n=1 Tax=Photorhabdus noenieputensis TaxID=1208607 RepID=UPI001FCFD464|nr:VOC family protein [Photorhabdus noenieputensis]MBS9439073.1 VOC family protein [Photorhabdus noenieputensis]MCK3668048.1 VOC family protein [Photorhabdus noenieputensis]